MASPLADAPTWPRHGNGDRIKPLGLLLSAAGRDKHCGKDATVAHCIAVQMHVELERARQIVERIASVEGHPNANAGMLAALELAICLVEQGEIGISWAQQAWERNELK